jgi:hypothetical protein
MRFFVTILALFGLSAAAAFGQASQSGIYDGRNIPGWTYSDEGTAAAGLPTWYPSDGSATQDGANCNIGASEVNGSLAEWMEYFNGVTPASFIQQLRQSGTNATRGYLSEVFQLSGRPAMRNLLAAQTSGQNLEFMIVSISGSDRLVTVTCTVISGQLLNRLDTFYSFADDLVLYTAAPR